MKRFDMVLSDILEILRRRKKTILSMGALFLVVALSFALTQEIKYLAEGTFRDKGNAKVSMQQSVSELLMGGTERQDSEAVSVMQSARLMEALIKRKGMQGSIVEKEEDSSWIEKLQQNFAVEWALLNRKKAPVIADVKKELSLSQIKYDQETYLTKEITFTDESHFNVKGGSKGVLGEVYKEDGAEFVLNKNSFKVPLKNKTFVVTLFPIKHIASELANVLVAKMDIDDRNLIRIKYLHRDRHHAAEFVNSLMHEYQSYLEEEHRRIAEAQLDYLKKREVEIGESLKLVMDDHAKRVKTDLTASGFTDSKKELEFLSGQLISTSQKMMQLRLDEKRLEKVLSGGVASFDQHSPGTADASIINEMLQRMRELKITRDSLDLALEEKRQIIAEGDFTGDLDQLKKLKGCCGEVESIINGHRLGQAQYLDDPKFMLAVWEKRLKNKEIDVTQFEGYLKQLKHLFQMQTRAIEERLQHRLKAPQDYQGITLTAAKDIYFALSRDRQENESEVKQLNFVIKQLDNPEFEITSLTSVLKDPVSHEKIMKASNLSHTLKDSENRTTRELDRIKDELRIQKEFLKLHLSEIVKLLDLRGDLLDEKSLLLQAAMLEMTGREVTVLEKQLYNYTTTRLYNLQIEKKMIEDQHFDLKSQLALIPDKWLQEQLLDQHLQSNQKMVESITSLVESKNISNNLELVQSAPLDWAVAPIHPKPPRILFLSILGAIMGVFFSSLYFVSKGILKDMPVTLENLVANGYKIAGKLQYKRKNKSVTATPENKDSLRRALSLIPQEIKSVICLSGVHRPPFDQIVTDLAFKKGQQVLFIDFHSSSPHGVNLSDYFDGRNIDEVIQEGVIYAKESEELVGHTKFKTLLSEASEWFDFVVGSSLVDLRSSETELLVENFGSALIGFKDETLSELSKLFTKIDSTNTTTVFMRYYK